ncbi:GNAT family N-acetyltransferase [Capnocytophaga sp.]|uniref:GNAT family N-acetyltransferase n=1 Tax=Capnocytophaga sp. TaxID=44737 RepID=UPI0026DC1271|nr:GNAT family N-acetyltransferase [Capnocytophaga sp.]MDO5105479.1 GNAT family N-acetyltransferase [Capnocytophaga sp.]
MNFRKASIQDFQDIWQLILYAKNVRKAEGSTQWQDGYPTEQTIENDILSGNGYVFTQNGTVLGYVAIIFGEEPAYEAIEGEWLSQSPYVVVHRMAVAAQAKGKGLGSQMLQKAEQLARDNAVESVRVDTNYDNFAMLKILDKQGYTYRGEVYFRGSARKAFEKIIKSNP